MEWFESIFTAFVNACVSIAGRLIISAIIFVIGMIFIKLVKKILTGKRFEKVDRTAMSFISNFIKIALYIVLIVIIVSIMGVPMASVITVFATAGAAIALAVQGSLSNLMGGIMLLIFRPISVGEFIDVSDNSGVVQEVGIFYTRIKTFDNVNISIPNGTMTSSVITNYSREELRRADMTVDVAYGSDIALVKDTILNVIDANKKALKEPAEPFIRVTAINDSALQFTVRVWCKASDLALFKSDFYEEIDAAFRKANIEIPFPQMDVHVTNQK
ncbi:MAG: mechanosensitive ion channel [Ruminococcaceae bacterium]|nr:mechanosensitive ion channel [Oscillospiraceae bacterium]